ncbi:ATP-dependent DNA helicase [Microbulbifer harenosus]|uniref:ATP-dependent DNA helicase n=1 Tax=Microbulbifer harenosus TaxID=2576840 RepID=A0ABY2UFS4_9GAMM|nr:ATP-dependent DNA helicase [Microbulbifer harenosus]TLM76452.1 ATP-dependent DNA helicase [Microbulbifer harenosus]
MTTRETLKLSVGELVAFSCRRGDLMADAPAGPTAQEGIRAHQRLQKKRPAGSEAEYRLQVACPLDGQTVQLSGRVDILHPQQDLHRPAQLDEIKTTYCTPDKLPEAVRDLHWAQLKIYGFCYLLQRQEETGKRPAPQDRLLLQMLWYNLKQKKSHPERREFNWPELEDFAHNAMRTYLNWHHAWQQHRLAVRTSARALEFPFPDYRPGQRELAIAAYRCLRDGGELVVEAPTGIGKTVSTLFPAVKALGEDHLDQLVYLTAKNSGRQVVRETTARLQALGLALSLLEIQAKDKTCACRQGLCSPDADGICPRTVGFFDRLPQARQRLLGVSRLTPDTLAKVADEFQLCPFELSLQMLPWVDLVVCDFNYVFDPLVRLNSLQTGDRRRALLVDEAHNLSERARGMYTAELTRKESRQAARDCTGLPTLRRSIQALVRALDQWVGERTDAERFAAGADRDNTEVWVSPLTNPPTQNADAKHVQRPESVMMAAHKVMATVSQMWEQSQPPPEEIREWLHNLYRFLTIIGLPALQHRCLTRRAHPDTPWQKQALKLFCLNAAEYLQQCYQHFQGVILFSATLRPAGYILPQLGVAADAPYFALPSPFVPEQMGTFLCPFVDTRYRARDSAADALVDLIARVYQSRPGNYLVFFPSYRFLQQVAERFSAQHPQVDIIQQTAAAGELERAAFLERFSENRRSLGFAIMGGIFGEGIDYVGEQLVGCILAGVGLPQISEEQELLRHAMASTGGNGFDIAYRYPGLTRVLQAAGRVIRTETDRGVVILADTRFAEPFYQPLLPAHWRLQTCATGEALSNALGNFWASAKGIDLAPTLRAEVE